MAFSENNPSNIDDGKDQKDNKKSTEKKADNPTKSIEAADKSSEKKVDDTKKNPTTLKEVVVVSERETNAFSADFGLYRQGLLSKVDFFTSFANLTNEKKRDVLVNTVDDFFTQSGRNSLSMQENIGNLLSGAESLPETSIPPTGEQMRQIALVCKEKNIDHAGIVTFLENYRTIIDLVKYWEEGVDTRGGVKYDYINPVRQRMSDYINNISSNVKAATKVDYMDMASRTNGDLNSGAILVFDEAIVQGLKKLGDDIPPLPPVIAKKSVPSRRRNLQEDYQ